MDLQVKKRKENKNKLVVTILLRTVVAGHKDRREDFRFILVSLLFLQMFYLNCIW